MMIVPIGPGPQQDTPYLVVSSGKVKDYCYVPLCGPSVALAYYEDGSSIREMIGQLNVLNFTFRIQDPVVSTWK